MVLFLSNRMSMNQILLIIRTGIIIDPTLRIQKIIPFAEDYSDVSALSNYM